MRRFLFALLCLSLATAVQAQTYSLTPTPRAQWLDANGNPIAGGKINTFQAGTSTPATTYSDTGGTPNANPVILDSSGRAVIYLLDGTCYKFTVTTSADVSVYTQDNICARSSYTTPSFSTVTVSSNDGLTVNGVIVPQAIEVTFHAIAAGAAGDQVDQTFFLANRAYQVTAVRFVAAAAETTANPANVQVVKDTSTNAPGAGTDLLTNNANAGFDLRGTANTVQTGTLTGTTANLQLAAGDRLSVDYAATGTLTQAAGVTITVTLKRI